MLHGSDTFKVDFTNKESITITNTGEEDIVLSGRRYGDEKAFIPSLYTEKKVKEGWEAYPWDWCGTGRVTYSIKPQESFTFPYRYHHAIGHVKVRILGRDYEFTNKTGHDLPSKTEERERHLVDAKAFTKEFNKIIETSDLKNRKELLMELKVKLTAHDQSVYGDLPKLIAQDLNTTETLLSHGITKRGTNKTGDDNSE